MGYTVIYRVGDTKHYSWRRAIGTYMSMNECDPVESDLRQRGYRCRVVAVRDLEVYGIPTNYAGRLAPYLS